MKKRKQQIAALLCTCMIVNLAFPASAGRQETPTRESSQTQISTDSNAGSDDQWTGNDLTQEQEKTDGKTEAEVDPGNNHEKKETENVKEVTETASDSDADKDTDASTQKKQPVRKALALAEEKAATDLSKAEIEVTGDCVYTGKKLTPEITVTLDGQELTEGTEYEVLYGRDVVGSLPSGIRDERGNNNCIAGEKYGLLQIKPAANSSYTGTKFYNFDIEKATLTDDNFSEYKNDLPAKLTDLHPIVTDDGKQKAVYGEGLSTNISFSPNGWQWKLENNETIILESLGKHIYKAFYPVNNSNINDPEVEIELDVQPRDLALVNKLYVNPTNNYIEYTGSAIEPELSVSVKMYRSTNYNLKEGEDYDVVRFENNINAGEASVIIQGKGNYTGQATETFTINSISGKKLLEKHNNYLSTNMYGDVILGIPFGMAFSDINLGTGWTWRNSGGQEPGHDFDVNAILEKRDYSCYASYTPDNVNYNDWSGNIKVNITQPRTLASTNTDLTVKFDGIADGKQPVFLYNEGRPVEPKVIITDLLWGKSDKTTLPETTYEVTYKNNTQVGTATAVITGKGVYTGTRELTFEIQEAPDTDIAKAKVTLSGTEFAYTGNAFTPDVKEVKLSGKTLTKDKDYTVSYDKNINPGAGYVIVTGTGTIGNGYHNTQLVPFFILPPSLTAEYGTLLKDISISKADGWTWTTPNVSAGDVGTHTLPANFNDGITQKNNVPVTVIVTAKDINDTSVAFNLNGAPFVYDPDKAVQPETVLMDNTRKQALIKDTDYEVTYQNNTNAGTGTVTVNGKGNYTGSRSLTFTIEKADCQLKVSGGKMGTDGVIKLMAREPASSFTVSRRGDGAITYDDGDKSVFSVAGTADGAALTPNGPGTAELTVEVAETANYKGASVKYPVSVSRIPIGRTEIQVEAPGEWTYSGAAFAPALTITDPKISLGNPLSLGTDYQVKYTDNINAGQAKITVSGLGDYEGSTVVYFTINKAEYQAEAPARVQAVYGQQLKELTLPKAENYDISWAWKQPESEVGNVGEHSAGVYLAGSRNYHEKTASVIVEVVPRTLEPSMAELAYTEHGYTGSAQEPEVTVTDRGRIVPADQYTISYANNIERGTAQVVLTGQGNYTGSITKEFAIVQAEIRAEHVTLEAAEWIYDGTPHTPDLTVTVYGRTLQKNVDYTAAYEENIHAGDHAAVLVTGQGNYTGTAKVLFTINKAVNPATPSNARYTAVYGQKLGEIAVEGDWDWENPEDTVGNAGENTHGIFLAETLDYLKKTDTAVVSVARKPLTDDMVSVDRNGLVYDGFAKYPAVLVNDNDAQITANDYECSYEDNLHAGEAAVTVRAKGNYIGEVKKTFIIEKAEPKLEIGAGLAVEKMLSDKSFSLEAVLSNGEGLAYASSQPEIASVDQQGTVTLHAAGTVKITVSYGGSQDYQPVQAVVELTVNERRASGGSGSSGGSSGSRLPFIYNSVPDGYMGETMIIGNAKVPTYVETGAWSQDADGSWRLTDNNAQPVVNRWIAAYNPFANLEGGQSAFDWFRFDAEGRMLTGWYQDMDGEMYYLNPYSDCTKGKMMTGWCLIDGIWYYFEPAPNGKRGRLLRNTVTPDGWRVDENGAWIVE